MTKTEWRDHVTFRTLTYRDGELVDVSKWYEVELFMHRMPDGQDRMWEQFGVVFVVLMLAATFL